MNDNKRSIIILMFNCVNKLPNSYNLLLGAIKTHYDKKNIIKCLEQEILNIRELNNDRCKQIIEKLKSDTI